jgi:hypothetical protein
MDTGSDVSEIKMYSDYKSPFAYLAFDPTFALEDRYRVRLRWIPFQLRLKGKGERSIFSEYKVKYSYLDARRWANIRGDMVLRGPLRYTTARRRLSAGSSRKPKASCSTTAARSMQHSSGANWRSTRSAQSRMLSQASARQSRSSATTSLRRAPAIIGKRRWKRRRTKCSARRRRQNRRHRGIGRVSYHLVSYRLASSGRPAARR